MESKIIFGIIAVFLIVIVGVLVAFGTGLIPNEIQDPNTSVDSKTVPTLELTPNSNKKDRESVKINVHAEVDDELGIKSITLPDGSVEKSDETSYKVTENGSYTFKVEANNGEIAEKTIEISNIKESASNSPYIPEGFSHVEGEVNDGYTIEDSYGNQYVWIPVESGKMIRNTSTNSNYEETNSSATELVNSVAQNYGYYVAKYEASESEVDGEAVTASVKGANPITNVTYLKASEMAARAANIYEYDGCYTAIMNSYAWDTMLDWIDSNNEGYSSSTDDGNYSDSVVETGKTTSDIKNNICDLAGNVREWTTEVYKRKEDEVSKNETSNNTTNETKVKTSVRYRVVRGGSANNIELSASSHTTYKENTSDAYWGFRMILYKK